MFKYGDELPVGDEQVKLSLVSHQAPDFPLWSSFSDSNGSYGNLGGEEPNPT